MFGSNVSSIYRQPVEYWQETICKSAKYFISMPSCSDNQNEYPEMENHLVGISKPIWNKNILLESDYNTISRQFLYAYKLCDMAKKIESSFLFPLFRAFNIFSALSLTIPLDLKFECESIFLDVRSWAYFGAFSCIFAWYFNHFQCVTLFSA